MWLANLFSSVLDQASPLSLQIIETLTDPITLTEKFPSLPLSLNTVPEVSPPTS